MLRGLEGWKKITTNVTEVGGGEAESRVDTRVEEKGWYKWEKRAHIGQVGQQRAGCLRSGTFILKSTSSATESIKNDPHVGFQD